MLAFPHKHVKPIRQRLQASAEAERYRRADEPEPAPSIDAPVGIAPVPPAHARVSERAAEDKDPVEQRVDEEEKNRVVHRRPRFAHRLEVEAHALVPAVGNRPEDVPSRVGTREFAYHAVEAQGVQYPVHEEEPGKKREHAEREPEARLLQPHAGHLLPPASHGLTAQCVEHLVERQRRDDEQGGDHVAEGGRREVGPGVVPAIFKVPDHDAVGRCHAHPAGVADPHGPPERPYRREFPAPRERLHRRARGLVVVLVEVLVVQKAPLLFILIRRRDLHQVVARCKGDVPLRRIRLARLIADQQGLVEPRLFVQLGHSIARARRCEPRGAEPGRKVHTPRVSPAWRSRYRVFVLPRDWLPHRGSLRPRAWRPSSTSTSGDVIASRTTR